MKNFIFKSQKDFDLQKMFQYTFGRLDTMASNIRYTNEMLNSFLKKLETDKALQKQVDEYFEDEQVHPSDERDLD